MLLDNDRQILLLKMYSINMLFWIYLFIIRLQILCFNCGKKQAFIHKREDSR